MTIAELEARVAQLERQMAQLLAARDNGHPARQQPGPDDWKQTIGMFDGDPVFKEMIEETKRRREAERKLAREQAE
jgi:hypothetical protein